MKLNPNRQVTYSMKEIRKIKSDAREQGLHEALRITSMLPMLALRDEYGFGQARMKRYLEKYHEILEAYLEDYITLEDVVEVMQDEIKIDMEEVVR